VLFKIKGADAQARMREILIDAVSEAEALRRVAEMGVIVTTVEGLSNKAPAATADAYSFPYCTSSRDTTSNKAPAATADAYPAISTYASIGRIYGWLTILFASVAAFVVASAGGRNLVIAFGVFFAGVLAGIGQLAFAELLGLFVKLQPNTQYICERLSTLEQSRKTKRTIPDANPVPGTSSEGDAAAT
jgi:hypothetical protein